MTTNDQQRMTANDNDNDQTKLTIANEINDDER